MDNDVVSALYGPPHGKETWKLRNQPKRSWWTSNHTGLFPLGICLLTKKIIRSAFVFAVFPLSPPLQEFSRTDNPGYRNSDSSCVHITYCAVTVCAKKYNIPMLTANASGMNDAQWLGVLDLPLGVSEWKTILSNPSHLILLTCNIDVSPVIIFF